MKRAIDEYMCQQSVDTTPRLSLQGLARAWDVPYRTLETELLTRYQDMTMHQGDLQHYQ